MDCSVIECTSKVKCKSLCNLHYLRKRNGVSLTLPKRKNLTHGLSQTSEYRSWKSMMYRCLDKTHIYYHNYGGRGIKICDRWLKIENFYTDMAPRPEGTTLDRIDSNGNYEPTNCRWATRAEQAVNTKRAIYSDTDKTTRINKLIDAGIDKDTIEYAMGIKLKP